MSLLFYPGLFAPLSGSGDLTTGRRADGSLESGGVADCAYTRPDNSEPSSDWKRPDDEAVTQRTKTTWHLRRRGERRSGRLRVDKVSPGRSLRCRNRPGRWRWDGGWRRVPAAGRRPLVSQNPRRGHLHSDSSHQPAVGPLPSSDLHWQEKPSCN